MWVYDINTLEFLEVNQAATIKYGYSKEEFMHMTIKDIRPIEDVEKLLENVKQENSELSQSEGWKHKKKNGEIIDIEIISHSISFKNRDARLVMSNDITVRKAAEKALKESEERYRNILELAPVGISIHQNGVIVYSNPESLKIFGANNPNELIGR
jgi:PAS domain S-box-containing protein